MLHYIQGYLKMDLSVFFKDLKVVELASVLAGPAVGMFFAELGADVLKVENPNTGGDVTRTWRIKGEKNDPAAYFHSINYKKQSIFLDLKDEEDYKKLLMHLQDADIVVSNYSDDIAFKLNVDYPTLQKRFPKLIFAQLNSFESDRSRPAYDVVLQAETGFLSMTGLDEQNLAKMPVALIDVLAAHQLKEGLLCAYIHRMKTGLGSKVTTSLESSAITSLINQATNYLMANHIPKPMGTLHPNIAPYGDIFTTEDRVKLVLAVGTEKQFTKLCDILKSTTLASDPRFSENALRVTNRAELQDALQTGFDKIDYESFSKVANQLKVPFGKIKNMKEVFQTQAAKDLLREENIPDGQSVRVSSVAFEIN